MRVVIDWHSIQFATIECSECGIRGRPLLRAGDESDLCAECLRKALALLEPLPPDAEQHWPIEAWRQAVAQDDTRQGYVEWAVMCQKTQDEEWA